MCIVDSATNYLWVKLLATKESENVREGLEQFLTTHKQYLQHGRPIRWHTDNGGEFMSDDLDDFCKEFAILFQVRPHQGHTPRCSQNHIY